MRFQRWQKRLNNAIHACFVKKKKTKKTDEHIRKPSNMDELMKKGKTILIKKTLFEDDEI